MTDKELWVYNGVITIIPLNFGCESNLLIQFITEIAAKWILNWWLLFSLNSNSGAYISKTSNSYSIVTAHLVFVLNITKKEFVYLSKEDKRTPCPCTYLVSWQLAPTVFQGSEQDFELVPVPWPKGGHTAIQEERS